MSDDDLTNGLIIESMKDNKTDYKDAYEKGQEKRRIRLNAEDHGRPADTTQGEIPLRRGKYGMDVEEYLEWKALEAARCKVKVPK